MTTTRSATTSADTASADVAAPDAIRVSDWYADLGEYTFPTVFLPLSAAELAGLAGGATSGGGVTGIQARIDRVIGELPGSSYIHADACAPTDAPAFMAHDIAVKSGKAAWAMLIASQKVRDAARLGTTSRICLHSYRRMDRVRELRMFFRDRQLVGMSQYNLQRHFGRLEGRRDAMWTAGQALAATIADRLPRPDLTVDIYVTSSGQLILLDMNPWGPPTDPLLYRDWDYDWSQPPALRLITKPLELKGDVEVNF